MKPSRSIFVDIRGLSYHVRCWGDASAPKMFLVHGWMDVSASFQFLVDALSRDWHVLAPDWRGFGLTQTPEDGYWFPDYVADLDALAHALAPGERVDVVGHSLGGNVAMLWAGARPESASHIVSLDAFGIPGEDSGRTPDKLRRWMDALREPPSFAPYANLAAVADRLQKNNRRLTRERAEFLAPHWAEALPDGTARLRADAKHKLPFPTTHHVDDVYATWSRIACPVLWIAADDSHVPKWLSPQGEPREEVARRFARVPHGTLKYVSDASHMLHHDRPGEVARLIEAFLTA